MAGSRTAVATIAAAAGALSAPASAADCMTDWGLAGQIVRRENLITVEEVAKSLAADGVGTLVKMTLCRSDDGYFYRLVIRGPAGELKTTIMTARVR